MEIRQETDGERKSFIARRSLEGLSEWFGIPESREAYIRESRDQLLFLRLQGRGAGRVPLPERNGEGYGGDCHGYAKRAVSKTVKFHAVILIEHMFHIKSRGVEFADQRSCLLFFIKTIYKYRKIWYK